MVRSNNHTDGSTRRHILCSMSGVSLGAVGTTVGTTRASNCKIPDNTGDLDEESFKRKETDTDFHTQEVDEGWGGGIWDYSCEIRGALLHLDSEYEGDFGQWRHSFIAGSFVTTQKKETSESASQYNHVGNLSKQALQIVNNEPEYAALAAVSHPSWVGAYPQSPDASDAPYEEFAFTVATTLIGMTNPILGASVTAMGLVSALANAGEEIDDPNSAGWYWNYDTDQMKCEGTSYAKFNMWSNEGETRANVETTSLASQHMGTGNVEVNFWNLVDADPICDPGEQCPESNANDTTPKPGTAEYLAYLEKSDVAEKIKPEESSTLSEERTVDGPIYRATNPRVIGGIGSTPLDISR